MAVTRTLNRLECVGETLRAALNRIATVAPDWLQAWVPVEWFERYRRAIEEYHLPKGIAARQAYAEGIAARQAYAEVIGADGMQLLERVWADSAPSELRTFPTLEILRQTWVNQREFDGI